MSASESNGVEEMRFEISKAAGVGTAAARLGRLVLPRREAVETPNFFAVTSRGMVPHLTPDTIARQHSRLTGAYMAMEDFVEKSQKNVTKIPAVHKIPAADGKRLHAFTALPRSCATILGPRRVPAVEAPTGNSNNHIRIFTSNGFQSLTTTAYINAIETLKPDIAIALADINYGGATTPRAKGLQRMRERSEEWMAELHKSFESDDLRSSGTSIFAPTLPAPYPMQWEYLRSLSEDLLDKLSGLAIYDVDILPDLLAECPTLTPLPRLSLDAPSGPHDILRQVSLGVDTFLLPFVNAVSDAGVAMTFTFPPPPPTSYSSTAPPAAAAAAAVGDGTDLLPLGIDLVLPEHTASLLGLVDSCTCYTCTHHHRAYLNHLLKTREMLAWTLLQIHNHHVMAAFFAGVRTSLASGADQFGHDCRTFARLYDVDLPAGMGTRPRARGYHFKSDGGDEKRNTPARTKLDGQGRGGGRGSDRARAELVAERLERGVVAETPPVVPDVDAAELVRDGFAEIDINRAQAS